MRTFSRYFLFLALCSRCCTASADTDDNVSYLVGNGYGVGPGDQKWRGTGSSAGVAVKFKYSTSTDDLVFYKPTQLGPAGVSLYWSQLNSASGGGYLYCNRGNTASGEPMAIENQMVDSGKRYGGCKLFEIPVLGLCYTLKISNIWLSYATANISSSGMHIGDSPTQYFRWIPESKATLYRSCNDADSSNKYWAVGGVWQSPMVEFYTDTNFDPTKTNKVTLSKPSGHLYSFKGYGLGSDINGHSHFPEIDFDLDSMTLSNPTCFTAAFTSLSVSGSAVRMGDYSPAQVKNGATAVPSDITLWGCIRVRNVGTRLKSNKADNVSKELLINVLTGNDAVKGVGVLTEDLKSTKSAQMVLKPSDPASVYKDYETEDDTTEGVYPDEGNGTSQSPHFQATLEQDGNIAIEPGDFKATSTFQVTYP